MTPNDRLTANKALVAEYVQAFYNDKDFRRARALLADDFHNHHPGVGVGADTTVDGFEKHVAAAFPHMSVTVLRVVAEGDQVWAHGIVTMAPDMPPAVVVDLWRIRDGLLAEHWDVGQAVPEGSTLDEMTGGGGT